MQATEQLSITLPAEIAQIVRDKIANGEYATESGSATACSVARDHATDKWLASEVLPAYDALRANPGSAIPIDNV